MFAFGLRVLRLCPALLLLGCSLTETVIEKNSSRMAFGRVEQVHVAPDGSVAIEGELVNLSPPAEQEETKTRYLIGDARAVSQALSELEIDSTNAKPVRITLADASGRTLRAWQIVPHDFESPPAEPSALPASFEGARVFAKGEPVPIDANGETVLVVFDPAIYFDRDLKWRVYPLLPFTLVFDAVSLPVQGLAILAQRMLIIPPLAILLS